LTNGIYYLTFPDGHLFGYYGYQGSRWIYHFEMGYEYVSLGNGPEVYLLDLASGHWFYPSPTSQVFTV
jgi:hypothetical protein